MLLKAVLSSSDRIYDHQTSVEYSFLRIHNTRTIGASSLPFPKSVIILQNSEQGKGEIFGDVVMNYNLSFQPLPAREKVSFGLERGAHLAPPSAQQQKAASATFVELVIHFPTGNDSLKFIVLRGTSRLFLEFSKKLAIPNVWLVWTLSSIQEQSRKNASLGHLRSE